MKKMLLSVIALFAAGMAYSQSYPKQPDPATVRVEYYKKQEVKPDAAKKEAVNQPAPKDEKNQPSPEFLKKDEKVKNSGRNAVAQNNK